MIDWYNDSLEYAIRLGHESGAVVSVVTRSDGFTFVLVKPKTGEARVIAGCRNFTIRQYKQHIRRYAADCGARFGRKKARETLAILKLFEIQLRWPLDHGE